MKSVPNTALVGVICIRKDSYFLEVLVLAHEFCLEFESSRYLQANEIKTPWLTRSKACYGLK